MITAELVSLAVLPLHVSPLISAVSRYDYHKLQHVPWPQSTSYTTLYNQRYLLLLPKHVGIDLVSASLCINWLRKPAGKYVNQQVLRLQETDRLLCTVVHRVVLLTVVELMQMDFLFMHPLLFPLCLFTAQTSQAMQQQSLI